MGYEVPGALGAQVGMPDKIVWSVAGDGGFQMTMSELATIVENNIPVKFALLNNRFLLQVLNHYLQVILHFLVLLSSLWDH